jgi:hypothetical protein
VIASSLVVQFSKSNFISLQQLSFESRKTNISCRPGFCNLNVFPDSNLFKTFFAAVCPQRQLL